MTINLTKAIPSIKTSVIKKVPEITHLGNSLKPLQADSFELSAKSNVVKVFNSLIKNTDGAERIVSPEFNGCHGVGIYQDDKIFFAHFPPFMQTRMKNAIESALENFDKNKKAQIVFVAPVSKNGTPDGQFEEYKKIILGKLKNDSNIEYLTYPNRSKDATYTYTGVIDNGILKNFLNKVQNKK